VVRPRLLARPRSGALPSRAALLPRLLHRLWVTTGCGSNA
jgi:hypothetical protein